jgi:hypothetical protein
MFLHMKLGINVPAAFKVNDVCHPTGGFGSRHLTAAPDCNFLVFLAFPPMAVLRLMTPVKQIFLGNHGCRRNVCSSSDID